MYGFPKMGVAWGSPIAGWFSMGKSDTKMDENWGYPYFRKPPDEEMVDLCGSNGNETSNVVNKFEPTKDWDHIGIIMV